MSISSNEDRLSVPVGGGLSSFCCWLDEAERVRGGSKLETAESITRVSESASGVGGVLVSACGGVKSVSSVSELLSLSEEEV